MGVEARRRRREGSRCRIHVKIQNHGLKIGSKIQIHGLKIGSKIEIQVWVITAFWTTWMWAVAAVLLLLLLASKCDAGCGWAAWGHGCSRPATASCSRPTRRYRPGPPRACCGRLVQ